MYLSSDQSLLTHPYNKGNRFTVTLPKSLSLEGRWSVCLLDIHIQFGAPTKTELYVGCDLATMSYVGGECHQILRRITTRNRTFKDTFLPQQYVNVENSSDIDCITISILDENTLQPTSLDIRKVRCALHLKRDSPAYI